MNEDPAAAPDEFKSALREAATMPGLVDQRSQLARLTVEVFTSVGRDLHVAGWIIGPDRAAGASPFNNGSDETVAVGTLLRIGGQLVGSALSLFEGAQAYAGAALLRQLVEVEYLAWAFEARDGDAVRWMRSTPADRQRLFSPANLRKGAGGRFRGEDYRFHCEHGGHPVPQVGALLDSDPATTQLLIADMLGHAGRIWDHVDHWARAASLGEFVLKRGDDMRSAFGAWKASDPLTQLPPPNLSAIRT